MSRSVLSLKILPWESILLRGNILSSLIAIASISWLLLLLILLLGVLSSLIYHLALLVLIGESVHSRSLLLIHSLVAWVLPDSFRLRIKGHILYSHLWLLIYVLAANIVARCSVCVIVSLISSAPSHTHGSSHI